ncbi:hypothetical protein R3P38DRAFT_2839437 [Favolaschia claudopus]|uniref:Uncharacterized protein n=1 Tax=Favolaschia claudopus TaxID=2862362 RepID=A0AAW0DZN6_9AGAR
MDRAWQKARLVEEHLREIENRIRRRRELEKEKIAGGARRNEIAKTQRKVREAWHRYEKGWEDLLKCQTNDECISQDVFTADDIGFFLLSPLHSEGQTTKERLKGARLIWHPDRFRKFLARVVDTDKAAVEKGLNELAAREMAKTHSM